MFLFGVSVWYTVSHFLNAKRDSDPRKIALRVNLFTSTQRVQFERSVVAHIAIPERKSENRKRKSVVPKQYTEEERKALDKRNLLIRKIRFVRKAYLNRFNYFATVTYFYGHFLYGTM